MTCYRLNSYYGIPRGLPRKPSRSCLILRNYCTLAMVKLYSVFQDKKTIKNAFAIFAVVAFEQVVSKYGINCRNALLWLYVPPGVLFFLAVIKSKNILFLVNRKTSKEKCVSPEMIGYGVAAFLYLVLPSIAWIISAFLNTKIWVCYRAGFDECGVVKKCSDDEKFAWNMLQRDAKFESQNIGLLLLSGAIIALAVITWLNHLLFARPLKERELNDLVREATRGVLERHVIDRVKQKLEELDDNIKNTSHNTPSEPVETPKSPDTTKELLHDLKWKKAVWLRKVDHKIDMFLDEFLVLDAVKMVYPEV
ncbi:uncharacterized protein LOC116619693 [Nematostella vectensis]|uniref:uncharacterized protein LOC116619693 n=1 Tax=Nematostella vectensis TaxID=45351 RepID=UPI0020777BCD|nr:uncharacterized protein LOC116619693 [Nematostella vectensis]